MRIALMTAAVGLNLALALPVAAQDVTCGSLRNHYGPFDYTDPDEVAEYLPVVEKHHLTPDVLRLVPIPGQSLPRDLDYVLRAFPNHSPALDAMARYQFENPWRPGSGYRTAECYFDRAMRFAPRDGQVRLVYGLYFYRKGLKDQALVRYQEAAELAPDSAEVHYLLGLLYFEFRRYDEAHVHAEKAYELGYPLPGLRQKLARVGRG